MQPTESDGYQEIEAKWARQEKVNEAKRKMIILLPPARTDREEENEAEDQQATIYHQRRPEQETDDFPSYKIVRRKQIILRITKRSIEAVIKTTTTEDLIETERMWKKKRPDKWEWDDVKQVKFI